MPVRAVFSAALGVVLLPGGAPRSGALGITILVAPLLIKAPTIMPRLFSESCKLTLRSLMSLPPPYTTYSAFASAEA